MKLAAYMSKNSISPEEMAAQLGDASASGVLKWMREERVPRPEQQRRIFEVTGGTVTPNDFVLPLTPERFDAAFGKRKRRPSPSREEVAS